LGGLPLAHEQAAAYCEQLGVSLSDYARRFAATPARLLDDHKRAPAEFHDGQTVARAFALAIEQAALLHPAAEALIVHAALLPPEPIPLFLFEEGRTQLGEPLATLLADDGLDEAIRALRVFALVDRETIADEREPVTTDTIRLHRLVREVAASGRTREDADGIRQSLLSAMRQVYPPGVFDDPSTWPRARRLDALALGLVEQDKIGAGGETDASWLLDSLASYRQGPLAAYAQARPLFEQALAIRETALGLDHPGTAASLNNLAFLLQSQGDTAEARPLFERALAICEIALGPEHPYTVMSLNNLAGLLQAQDDLSGARPLFERALKVREKVLGADHPNTAVSLNNLALVLQLQGDLAAARPLIERALAINEKALGPDHPGTARVLSNLARLLHDRGDLTGARPLFERALAIREKGLGPDHPDTARSRNALASLLHAHGDFAGAQLLFERALAIYEQALGPGHLDTTLIRTNLARLLLDRGQAPEAASQGERALIVQEAKLGATHAWTVASARVTADAWDALGRSQDAAALRERFGL
jgi:tetratricopeptide (TPR) repeat protein